MQVTGLVWVGCLIRRGCGRRRVGCMGCVWCVGVTGCVGVRVQVAEVGEAGDGCGHLHEDGAWSGPGIVSSPSFRGAYRHHSEGRTAARPSPRQGARLLIWVRVSGGRGGVWFLGRWVVRGWWFRSRLGLSPGRFRRSCVGRGAGLAAPAPAPAPGGSGQGARSRECSARRWIATDVPKCPREGGCHVGCGSRFGRSRVSAATA